MGRKIKLIDRQKQAARKEARRNFKLAKMQQRTDRKSIRKEMVEARADARVDVAEAKYDAQKVAYENGVQPTTAVGSVTKMVGDVADDFFKSKKYGGGEETTEITKDNTMMYVGIGAVAIVALMMFKK